MDRSRINPVALIAGATSGLGAACAADIARRADGGLILVDADEAALSALADQLEAKNATPERLSTLAIDITDPERWAAAASFITSQYGRLDWAIVNAVALAPPAQTDLVQWGQPSAADLEAIVRTLQAVMPLMRANAQGGAIVISALAASIKLNQDPASAALRPDLLQVLRAAVKEGAPDNIRINAVAQGAAQSPPWTSLPWFKDVVHDAGGDRAALEKISTAAKPLARYAGTGDLSQLVAMLASDDAPVTGVTLVVDGGYTL